MTTDKYAKRIKSLENLVENQGKQLKELNDLWELQKLHTNYAYWLCTREWKKIVDLFADDAIIILHRRGRFEGKKEITDIFKQIVQNNRGKGRDGHLAMQPIIHVDGDSANAQWLMYIMMLDPHGGYENTWGGGRHDVEYVRINGKWKMRYMIFTSPWPREGWTHPTLDQLKDWTDPILDRLKQ
jgi:ketosteroid isomerase-like protein